MSDYQRNGSPETSIWRTNADEFRGYVRAKLEDLEDIQKNQWKTHRETQKRIRILERRGYYINGGLAVINIVIIALWGCYTSGLIRF